MQDVTLEMSSVSLASSSRWSSFPFSAFSKIMMYAVLNVARTANALDKLLWIIWAVIALTAIEKNFFAQRWDCTKKILARSVRDYDILIRKPRPHQRIFSGPHSRRSAERCHFKAAEKKTLEWNCSGRNDKWFAVLFMVRAHSTLNLCVGRHRIMVRTRNFNENKFSNHYLKSIAPMKGLANAYTTLRRVVQYF